MSGSLEDLLILLNQLGPGLGIIRRKGFGIDPSATFVDFQQLGGNVLRDRYPYQEDIWECLGDNLTYVMVPIEQNQDRAHGGWKK